MKLNTVAKGSSEILGKNAGKQNKKVVFQTEHHPENHLNLNDESMGDEEEIGGNMTGFAPKR